MPLDPALEGRSLPSRTITVSDEHARAFAGAVGETAAGVPPTFLTTLQIGAALALADDPDVELDFSGVLHGEEEYEWERQLEVGDRLTIEPRIERITARRDSEFVTIRSEVRDDGGDIVARARTVLIVRGRS